MSLPDQLQRQVDAAKSIIEQHYGTPESSEAAADSASPEPAAVEPSPAPAPAPAAPARTEEVATGDDENSPTYAQRWRSLQGVYSAAQRQLEAERARAHALEQLVATMQTARPAPAAAPAAPRIVTDKDMSEYGEDMVEFARRVAREQAAPLEATIQQLQQRLEQLQGVVPAVQQVAANQQQSAEETFLNRLTAAIPNWALINEDRKFHQWLMTQDAMTGITRQTYLEDAHKNRDLSRVANIFRAAMKELGLEAAPSAAPAPASTAASKLERQVAPGRASAAAPAPSTANNKRTWSPSEIQAFYDDKRRGKYSGREAEASRLERDIFDAQREGRIARQAA